MIRDSSNFQSFIKAVDAQIERLTNIALNPTTPYEATQSARVRIAQLKEVRAFATGESTELN